jgi:hypothetical protein
MSASNDLSDDEIADLKEAFSMFDINGDGKVSLLVDMDMTARTFDTICLDIFIRVMAVIHFVGLFHFHNDCLTLVSHFQRNN